MKIIKINSALKFSGLPCVATIGNFDGIHLAHQELFKLVKKQAKIHKKTSIVITFEPQPYEFFHHDLHPIRLTSLREKIIELKKYDIDILVIIPFTSALASMSANDFVKNILINQLNINHLIVGDDFHLGRNREADFSLIKHQFNANDFLIEQIDSIRIDNKRISSTWARQLLVQNNLLKAQELLGRPYSIYGKVIQGDQNGRILGFPTANVLLTRRSLPLDGVYSVNVKNLSANPILGIANIGYRPTFRRQNIQQNLILEIHLLDFNSELYGQFIHVEFLHKIRNEKIFSSPSSLKKQIVKDIKTAKSLMNTNTLG